MDELEALRQKASTLITQSGDDPGALERGALLLRTVAEVEKDRAEAQRLRHEASGGRANALDYVKVLAPWATVLVSLATIMVQSFQSHTARAAEKWERTFVSVGPSTF